MLLADLDSIALSMIALAQVAEQPGAASGNPVAVPQVSRGLFSTPRDDLLTGRSPDLQTETGRLSVGLGITLPLSKSSENAGGAGTQGPSKTNAATQLQLKYVPVDYWFATTTLYQYFHPSQEQRWEPDFTYAFGYDDWHPNTASLVYSNYGGNRFRPDRARGEQVTKFNEGTWSLGWKFELPEALGPIFLIDAEDAIGCLGAYNYAPRYAVAEGGTRSSMQTLSVSCKYSFPNGWYVSATVYEYPKSGQQQPWNPDYTYSFGRFDWHSGAVSFQYSNYSGNRWPGRERGASTGRFKDGNLGIAWSMNF